MAIIVARLLYGAESWPPLGPDHDARLQHVIAQVLRHCSKAWSPFAPTSVPDQEVYRLSGLPS
eukprot:10470-Prorocentrum_lima.AAC.1